MTSETPMTIRDVESVNDYLIKTVISQKRIPVDDYFNLPICIKEFRKHLKMTICAIVPVKQSV
jgi:hypothetical protein